MIQASMPRKDRLEIVKEDFEAETGFIQWKYVLICNK